MVRYGDVNPYCTTLAIANACDIDLFSVIHEQGTRIHPCIYNLDNLMNGGTEERREMLNYLFENYVMPPYPQGLDPPLYLVGVIQRHDSRMPPKKRRRIFGS